jgi:virulence-associated protein VapD
MTHINAQNQHFIPQFILRHFLSDKHREHVSVFDKKTGKEFRTPLRNIMAERRFYDFQIGEESVSLEPLMGLFETEIAPEYERIVKAQALDHSTNDKMVLAKLFAIQFLRVPWYRKAFSDLHSQIKSKFEIEGENLDNIEVIEPLTESIIKKYHAKNIINDVERISNLMMGKDFFLTKSKVGRYFYIGDCPVILHNSRSNGPFGNLGLDVAGIQIYLPLSSDLVACAFFPTISTEILEMQQKQLQSIQNDVRQAMASGKITFTEGSAFLRNAEQEIKKNQLLDAMHSGKTLSSSDENMDFYNSLQTSNAERFVICPKGQFGFARRVAEADAAQGGSGYRVKLQ